MAIAQFTDLFWFPSGALAVGMSARVFPLNSNVLAPLFSDAAGTIPLANPVVTDNTGTITFYAEEGDYWLHIDTETFQIHVGQIPINPMSELASTTLSTGVVSGGEMNPVADPTAIEILSLVGYIVDHTTDPMNPTVTRVTADTQEVQLDAASQLRSVTWWLMDVVGNVIQQGTTPTNTQRRTHLVLGVSTFFGGQVVLVQTLPVILPQSTNQLYDLMGALGPFNIAGNLITPAGLNLTIAQTSGTMFARSFSHFINGVLTDDPHIVNTPAQSPAQFRYTTASATVFGPLRTTIDVANFDNGGVITPIGGGANTSAIHRVWLFGTGEASTQMLIQYGQTTYASLSAAASALGRSGHVVNPLILGNGALLTYLIATRTATDLSNPAQATFIAAGKFAAP